MSEFIVITTRLDREMHTAAKRKAKADGRSLANYLRRLIEQDVLERHFTSNGNGSDPSVHLGGRSILGAVPRDC